MTGLSISPSRRLSLVEGERRSRGELAAPDWSAAVFRDAAVHDAVRILGLVPASSGKSGYDAHRFGVRFRIAGCLATERRLAAGALRKGRWERALLVSMSAELEPLAIDELPSEAAHATRSIARLQAAGHRRWERA